ncbi:uncharacterized protein V6R79_022664 [Siganus canaliculatus]
MCRQLFCSGCRISTLDSGTKSSQFSCYCFATTVKIDDLQDNLGLFTRHESFKLSYGHSEVTKVNSESHTLMHPSVLTFTQSKSVYKSEILTDRYFHVLTPNQIQFLVREFIFTNTPTAALSLEEAAPEVTGCGMNSESVCGTERSSRFLLSRSSESNGVRTQLAGRKVCRLCLCTTYSTVTLVLNLISQLGSAILMWQKHRHTHTNISSRVCFAVEVSSPGMALFPSSLNNLYQMIMNTFEIEGTQKRALQLCQSQGEEVSPPPPPPPPSPLPSSPPHPPDTAQAKRSDCSS